MNEFSFSVPQNITVGKGSLAKLPEIAKKLRRLTCISYVRTASGEDGACGEGGKFFEDLQGFPLIHLQI